MYSGMRSTVPISASMLRAASFAPPWAGPHRQAMPAAIQAKGLAPDDPARRTVEVEAFCSWSAWRMKIRSVARERIGVTCSTSGGTAKHTLRKFVEESRESGGYTKGWPMEYLYAIAAIVGILAIIRSEAVIRCCASNRSSESW